MTGDYAHINGLKLYFEIQGQGKPLVLLHGGLGTTAMFEPWLLSLTQTRQTIAVELQAHGHTADIDRPLSYEHMADDIAALIRHLELEKPDVLGYSLGGGVALQAGIRHPEVVRKLVLVSTPYRRDGWYPEVLAGMAAMNAESAKAMVASPMYAAYASAAPKPEDFSTLVAKVGDLLRRDYDWSAGVAALKMPTLIVVGDADSIAPTHVVEMFRLLGGGQRDAGWDGSGMPASRLAVLPATTHYDILTHLELLLPIITRFLDAPAG